jgi:hypothetical protein
MVEIAKLNNVDPQAWLTDVLAIAGSSGRADRESPALELEAGAPATGRRPSQSSLRCQRPYPRLSRTRTIDLPSRLLYCDPSSPAALMTAWNFSASDLM